MKNKETENNRLTKTQNRELNQSMLPIYEELGQ